MRSAGCGGSGSGGGGGSGSEDKTAGGPQAVPQLDLYGVITREGSAANGGWFEVQLDSQLDKKVYYRRGSICKLKQQPHSQQQQTTVAAVRAITHSSHVQQASSGVLAAAIATPATLFSAPSSPQTFVIQHQPTQQLPLPSTTLMLSPTMAHGCEAGPSSLYMQQCVTSPLARPVCTCSLGCSPLLPSAPLSFVSSASARRASTGSVDGALSLSFAALPTASNDGGFSPSGAAAGCFELHSPPFAAASRSVSTPSRPLSIGESLFNSLASDSSHPSAFTSVVSTASTAVLAPRAVRVSDSVVSRSTIHAALPPLSAPVLPLSASVAVPAAHRIAVGCSSTAAAIPVASFRQPHQSTVSSVHPAYCERAGLDRSSTLLCLDASSKRRRLSLEEVEPLMLRSLGTSAAMSAACSTTACLPAAFVQPTLCHSVALCSL